MDTSFLSFKLFSNAIRIKLFSISVFKIIFILVPVPSVEHAFSCLRIDCAEDPSVTMVCDDYFFLRVHFPVDCSDYVPDRPNSAIHVKFYVDFGCAWSNMVCEWQSALPIMWHSRTRQDCSEVSRHYRKKSVCKECAEFFLHL